MDAVRAEKPRLSVVIAASDSADAVASCLDSLGAINPHIEVIVAFASGRMVLGDLGRKVIRVPCPPRSDVHLLRKLGFDRSRGECVVFTEDSERLGRGWIDGWSDFVKNPGISAATGPVEPGSRLSLVDWAVFFCEYAPFVPPMRGATPSRLAGNNFGVRREVVEHNPANQRGIRESDIHRTIAARGGIIVYASSAIVRHLRVYSLAEAICGRLRFGFDFGAASGKGWRPHHRLIRIALGPLALASQVGRLVWTLLRKRRLGGNFVEAAPLTVALLTAWSVGEWLGWLRSIFFANDEEQRPNALRKRLAEPRPHDAVVDPSQSSLDHAKITEAGLWKNGRNEQTLPKGTSSHLTLPPA